MIAPSRRARKGFDRGKIRKLRRRLRKRSKRGGNKNTAAAAI
jgi:hypothetical protein